MLLTISWRLKSNNQRRYSGSREKTFGRKIFQAYLNEYGNSHLNEKSETAKLMKVVEKKDMELAEAKKESQRRKLLLSPKDAEIKAAQDKAERTQVMNELLNL